MFARCKSLLESQNWIRSEESTYGECMGWTLSRRVWLVLGAVVLLVVLLLYLNSRRPVAGVAVVQVERESLSSSIATNGKVEPTTPFPLRAKFDGFVEQVSAVEGQNVKSGQLLLVLDDRDIRAQLDDARSQLAQEQDGKGIFWCLKLCRKMLVLALLLRSLV